MPGAPITVPGPIPNKTSAATLVAPLFGYYHADSGGGAAVGYGQFAPSVPQAGFWTFYISGPGNSQSGSLSVISRRLRKGDTISTTTAGSGPNTRIIATFPDGSVVNSQPAAGSPTGGDVNLMGGASPPVYNGFASTGVGDTTSGVGGPTSILGFLVSA